VIQQIFSELQRIVWGNVPSTRAAVMSFAPAAASIALGIAGAICRAQESSTLKTVTQS
jgi:hypothetical protein